MKKWINTLSIQNKLTLLMTIVCFITLLVSTSIITAIQISNAKDDVVESTSAKAKLIAFGTEAAILFNDETSAYRNLDVLRDDSSIIYAAIIISDGSILANYIVKNKHLDYLDNFQIPFLTAKKTIDVLENMVVEGEIIGFVLLRTTLEKFHKQVLSFAIINLSVLIFGVLFAFILAIKFSEIITMPIKKIVEHIENIRQTSDFDTQLQIDNTDEIGRLASGFNHMLSVVKNREEKLSSWSDHLQSLVDDRTQQLEHKAHYDSITELPNRYLLVDRLKQEISISKREHQKLALLFLDLDRFKIINDSLGHDVGDQLLRSVAKRLCSLQREGDTYSRFGGDEFVLLLHNIGQTDNAARAANRIIKHFSKPFILENHTLHVTTSIGISIYPDDGTDNQTLIKNADISMYHAKTTGVGKYCYFSEDMNVTSTKRLSLENRLRNAIENREFSLVFQPIVKLASGEVESFEALIRWNNDELGFVPPNDFIPIAEEIGMIEDIGNWVITTVCCQLSNWRDIGFDDIKVAINISASHIMNVKLLEHLKTETKRNNIECNQLKIEITEDVFLNNSSRIVDALIEIRKIGVHISIDDFGTGYSSLRYIQEFPVDTLKIDGMFVRDLETNKSSRGIVSSTILLAHSLGLTVVCECVEDVKQLNFLQQEKCDYIQGYYFSKPVPIKDVQSILVKPFIIPTVE